MASFFRQLNRGASQFFGRQLPQSFNKFGRQLTTGAKQLPQAFKDSSKMYSDLERKTHSIPVVSNIFGTASHATGGIGHLLGGNLNKAFQEGKSAFAQGKQTLAQGGELATKVAPMFA
jgi:hypothetical protein